MNSSQTIYSNQMTVPEDLFVNLEQNPPALKKFEKLYPIKKRQYIEWIMDAKRNSTRQRRIDKTIDILSYDLPFQQ